MNDYKYNKGKYIPTINLDTYTYACVMEDVIPLKVGQWVQIGNKKGQYLRHDDEEIFISPCGRGDGFHGRTQRFARAAWHHHQGERNVMELFRRAPDSLRMGDLKSALKKYASRRII